MFATKTAKTAAPAVAEHNGADVAFAVADLVAALTPAAAPRAPRVRTSQIAPCACARFVVADGTLTGCSATTKRVFAPGHDARLKGVLIRAGVAGLGVTDAEGDATRSAQETAELFGFGDLVAEGIRRGRAKLAEKAAAKAAKTTAQTAPKAPSVAEAVAQAEAEEAAQKAAEAEATRARLAEADAAWEEIDPAEERAALEEAVVADAEADAFAALLAETVAEAEQEVPAKAPAKRRARRNSK